VVLGNKMGQDFGCLGGVQIPDDLGSVAPVDQVVEDRRQSAAHTEQQRTEAGQRSRRE
jgi:hypothetical protein